MRLFIGIPLSATVTEELTSVVARYARSNDGLRWSKAESWHITLQFLGASTAEQYQCIIPRLKAIASASFAIHLSGLDFFERSGVFFAGVKVSPHLASLQQQVTQATSSCGFVPEERAYHPHITLARNKGRENGVRNLMPRVDKKAHFSAFTADEFLVYESFPGPTGSRYEVRERFALRAPSEVDL